MSELVFRKANKIYDENETAISIYNAQNLELNRFTNEAKRAFKNNFIITADESGVKFETNKI